MSICKPHIHLWTVNMHFIVLLCIFTRILAHRSDIFDDWENAQVFIYERRIGLPRPHSDTSELYPSCFGILLTSKHVITAISCFFDVTQSNNADVNSLKFDPKKAFVVTVNPPDTRSIYPDDFEGFVLMYCIKRKALDDSKAKFLKEQYKVLKLFVGKSDLSILELKKKVKNEKFNSVGIFSGNGKQSSVS